MTTEDRQEAVKSDAVTLDAARARVGDAVIYHPGHGNVEQGYITSVNDRYVFVRYGAHPNGIATDPTALTFLAGLSERTERK